MSYQQVTTAVFGYFCSSVSFARFVGKQLVLVLPSLARVLTNRAVSIRSCILCTIISDLMYRRIQIFFIELQLQIIPSTLHYVKLAFSDLLRDTNITRFGSCPTINSASEDTSHKKLKFCIQFSVLKVSCCNIR